MSAVSLVWKDPPPDGRKRDNAERRRHRSVPVEIVLLFAELQRNQGKWCLWREGVFPAVGTRLRQYASALGVPIETAVRRTNGASRGDLYVRAVAS